MAELRYAVARSNRRPSGTGLPRPQKEIEMRLIGRLLPLSLAVAGAALTLAARPAHACDERAPERYRSATTIWCVNPGIWAGHQAEVESFFPYGDKVVAKLEELFAVTPDDLPYTIEVMEPNGYAMTPSNYGPGVAVTGDAFYNDFAGVQGYWGYLLVLHEFVNQWTGLVTGGWPTDWWADHRSPFPNSMDEQIMRTLGLNEAADAQHSRFADRNSGDYDAQVVMFNDLFDAHGFAGLRKAFQLIQGDGLKWFDLKDPPAYQDQTEFVSGNPSALLSNFVTAYLSLGAGEDVTASFLAAQVGQRPPNWEGNWVDTSPDSQTVTAIANAHCSIAAAAAAGTAVTDARSALRKGDYASAQVAATANCAADCPGECACKENACVAPWVTGATPQPPSSGADAGPGGPDGGVDAGCGCTVDGGARGLSSFLALALTVVVLGRIRRRRA